MREDDIRILNGDQILALLAGREAELIQTVRRAYEAHADGASSLPHSNFLLFPDQPQDRIIALPAYLGGDFGVAGIKWIASFPGNFDLGLERASAVIVMNSVQTGRPEAILEGSIISAKRTAASAALAAQRLHADPAVTRVGLIGCGLINFEIARFLLAVFPNVGELVLFDKNVEQLQRFGARCQRLRDGLEFRPAPDARRVFQDAALVSLATTSSAPHLFDVTFRPGSTVLHISLRDLSPEIILANDNVVDDPDHVCRARTSIHLAEQRVGHRDFIRCTLADVTRGAAPARRTPDGVTVFSPFGLGVLDLALGQQVLMWARVQNQGTFIQSFFPAPWLEREAIGVDVG